MDWPDVGIPLLIAEVMSPSTARFDRITKRHRYQESRVGQYWIVDADGRTVERWEPDNERPEILEREVEWHPAPATEPLVIDLDGFFREVWGEGD